MITVYGGHEHATAVADAKRAPIACKETMPTAFVAAPRCLKGSIEPHSFATAFKLNAGSAPAGDRYEVGDDRRCGDRDMSDFTIKMIVTGAVIAAAAALIFSRYDISINTSGAAYVADRDTGDVYFCLGNGCQNLPGRSRY